ncbi:MAG TPA: hypothetical protein VMC42_05420 [Methanoregulaceae archaeon]|nr:hypothetical protein [Methanoregulaceae archaeon]
MFQPVAAVREPFPTNTKVFNLCLMKRIGVDAWAKDESGQNRNAYYRGKSEQGRSRNNFSFG